MMSEAKKTSVADLMPILSTVAKIAAVIFVLATGNILLAGAAYYYYNQYQKRTNPEYAAAPSMLSSCTVM